MFSRLGPITSARLFVVLVAVLLVACDETGTQALGVCPGPDSPEDAACRWEPTENSLIMRVEGGITSGQQVFVIYENEDAGRFSTAPVAATAEGRYEITVPRLRAETDYSFRVIEVNPDGTLVETRGGEFTTGALPEALELADFEVEGENPTIDLVFMDFNIEPEEEEEEAEGTPEQATGTSEATAVPTTEDTPVPEGPTFYGLIAIDNDGEIVWYVETEYSQAMAQKPDGNIVLIEQYRGLKEITPMGDVVRVSPSPCPDSIFHHEMQVMPDGRIMSVGYTIRDVFNDPERPQAGDTIVIWDPDSGEPQDVWNAFDHIDAITERTPDSDARDGFMWRGCSADLPTQDWTHANAATVGLDGNIIFSMRHLDQVIAISPDFQNIAWRLGGPGSDFTFPEPSDRFFHQHASFQLPNGNILVFDNGNTRPEEEGGEYSRALELELNFEDMTARKVWEYKQDPPLYARAVSNAIRLPNGHTQVHFGTDSEEVLTIVEADENGGEVWKTRISAPGLSYIYRSYPAASIWGEVPIPVQ